MAQNTESIRIEQNIRDQLKLLGFGPIPKYVNSTIQPVFVVNDDLANQSIEVVSYNCDAGSGTIYTTRNDPKKVFYLTSVNFASVGDGNIIITQPSYISAEIIAGKPQTIYTGPIQQVGSLTSNGTCGGGITFNSPLPIARNTTIDYNSGFSGNELGFATITGFYSDKQ